MMARIIMADACVTVFNLGLIFASLTWQILLLCKIKLLWGQAHAET